MKTDMARQNRTAYRIETDRLVLSLFAADYPDSPAANTVFRAFDCMGEAIN